MDGAGFSAPPVRDPNVAGEGPETNASSNAAASSGALQTAAAEAEAKPSLSTARGVAEAATAHSFAGPDSGAKTAADPTKSPLDAHDAPSAVSKTTTVESSKEGGNAPVAAKESASDPSAGLAGTAKADQDRMDVDPAPSSERINAGPVSAGSSSAKEPGSSSSTNSNANAANRPDSQALETGQKLEEPTANRSIGPNQQAESDSDATKTKNLSSDKSPQANKPGSSDVPDQAQSSTATPAAAKLEDRSVAKGGDAAETQKSGTEAQKELGNSSSEHPGAQVAKGQATPSAQNGLDAAEANTSSAISTPKPVDEDTSMQGPSDLKSSSDSKVDEEAKQATGAPTTQKDQLVGKAAGGGGDTSAGQTKGSHLDDDSTGPARRDADGKATSSLRGTEGSTATKDQEMKMREADDAALRTAQRAPERNGGVHEERANQALREDPQDSIKVKQEDSSKSSLYPTNVPAASSKSPSPLTRPDAGTSHANSPAPGPNVQVDARENEMYPRETPQQAREREQAELQRQRERENEEIRLLWLSLPANDHPSYYSETDASSHGGRSRASVVSSADLIDRETEPFIPPPSTSYLTNGHAAPQSLLHQQAAHIRLDGLDEELEESAMRASLSDPLQRHGNLNGKRHAESIYLPDEIDSDLEEHYQLKKQKLMEVHKYRRGNRGNKLKRREGARWVRTKKLGPYTEARNEKEVNDRIRVRIAALQRAGIRALLDGAPEPTPKIEDPSLDDPLPYLTDDEGPLTSTALASALLRPILTARALLESHTLKHTFRNPHIGALSKTATDLRESESVVGRALGRCFTAMEGTTLEAEAKEDATFREREIARKKAPPLMLPPAADAADLSGDSIRAEADVIPPNPELDPAFTRLDKLFVTPGGLPIPLPEPLPPGADPSTQPAHPPPQAILTVGQQQEVVRAALDCLHELAADSKEYIERLDEVRSRLASVKQKRAVVWNAIRVWALAREKRDHTGGSDSGSNDDEQSEEDGDDDYNYPVSLVEAMQAAQEQAVGNTPSRRRAAAAGASSAGMTAAASRTGTSSRRK